MIQDTTVQRDKVSKVLSGEITRIDDFLEDLEKKTKSATQKEESFTEIFKALRVMASNVDRGLSGKREFQFFCYQIGKLSSDNVEKICGSLITKDINVALSKWKAQCTGILKKLKSQICVTCSTE